MTISQITPNNGTSYVDHEFMHDALGQLWMVWQDVPRNWARVSLLNPQTGHFLNSDDGFDMPVAAKNLAALGRVGKGPSLVRDSEGWYVVFNRVNGEHTEIWESRPELNGQGIPVDWTERRITGEGVRQNVLPILEWEREQYVLTYRGPQFCYRERWEDDEHEVEPKMSGSHRACGPYYVSVTNRVPRNIWLTDVDSGESRQITDDRVNLFDPYWIEAKGRRFAMALVDQSYIRVYRGATPYYEHMRDIHVPHKALRGYPREEIGVQSAEFFQDHEGNVWVVPTWKATRDRILETAQAEIWAHGITGPEAGRSFQVSKREKGVVTHEGEPYVAHKASFVWYSRVNPEHGRVEIWVNTDPFSERGAFARAHLWCCGLVDRAFGYSRTLLRNRIQVRRQK